MTIGGVLYLHDISNKCFTGTARMNLMIFRHLCEDAVFDKVIIGTTNWGVNAFDRDQQREEEMRAEHWSTLLEQGAEVRRFLRSSASAWDILNIFLQRSDNARRFAQDVYPLQIQREMIEPEERRRRKNKLAAHWKPIIDKGAVMHHFRKEASSVWAFIKEFIRAPSNLGRSSRPQTLISPLPDAQITIVREQGSSSLALDATILDDCQKTDIVILCVRFY